MNLAECLEVSSHVPTLKHEAKHGYMTQKWLFVCFHEAAERVTFGLYFRPHTLSENSRFGPQIENRKTKTHTHTHRFAQTFLLGLYTDFILFVQPYSNPNQVMP